MSQPNRRNLTPDHRQFAATSFEQECLDLYLKNGRTRDAVKALEVERHMVSNALSRIKDRAALQGFSPEHDMTRTAPDTHFVKGTSTLYDGEGKLRLQWVKTDKKMQDQQRVMREMIEALKEDLPRAEPVPTPEGKNFSSDHLAVYPMGDPHLGAFGWSEEVGEDFDLKIAERNLCAAVDRLVDTAPPCKEALVINLGDFFHADNLESRTSRSGHHLDTDTRWPKVLRVGIAAMRQCIVSALRKHERVSVINAIGNHDDHSAMFLSVALANIYQDEPRVNVIDTPTMRHYYRFHDVLIGVSHGHTVKTDTLPLVMATERPEDWGGTRHRYIYCGHIHHQRVQEIAGTPVEYFRTLAGKDAWHASMGYHAGRDMKCIIHHKNFGEVERHTVSVQMLQAAEK